MTTEKEIRVLITGSGTVTCQSVIKGLRHQDEIDVYIVTIDPNPESAGRYFSDKFYEIPFANDDDFIPKLTEIISKEKIDLLVPIVDYEFEKITAAVDDLKKIGCTTAISSPKTISICNKKEKTFEFFRDIGIDTPYTYNSDELKELDKLPYPLFIKPREGRASIGAEIVKDKNTLNRMLKDADEPMIVQENIEGKEYTVDVFCNFDSEVLGIVPRQRKETKVGVSYKGETVDNLKIIEKAKYIAEKLKIVGHCNMQLFITPDDTYSFFEVNPRYSGTLALTLAAGLNSPLMLCKLILGEMVKPVIGEYEKGLLMLRYWEEVFVKSDGSVLEIEKLTNV